MQLKRIFMWSLLCLLILPAHGEATNSPDQTPVWGIRFSGFIKSDYWYDSRQVVAAREDLFLLFPADNSPDREGRDINAEPGFNYSAITSRLTGVITGPDAFGAKTSGVLEADFSGVTNADINGFRLRHAFGKLRWERSELLFGQYWHPMFVVEAFPHVISLNTGAPFQPFIRNPQIAFTQYFGQYSLNLTLLSQRDNTSDGPLGPRPDYMRNALLPNVHLQLQHKGEAFVWGAAADYKWLRPRMVTDSLLLTRETIGTWALMAYGSYARPGFAIRSKAIYGQNLTEHLLLGGYALRSHDQLTGLETYTPTNHLFVWGNITYGRRVQAGLFAGYARNLGTTHANEGIYFARGHNIGYMYRVAPALSFISNAVQISTELEYTVAGYGEPDTRGRINQPEAIGNLRALITFFYFF
jgi:hypothetical protein